MDPERSATTDGEYPRYHFPRDFQTPPHTHYCVWCWSTSIVRTIPQPGGLFGALLTVLRRKHYTCRDCRRWFLDVPLVHAD